MDCNPPGFSVHGILQARILEWVVMPFSRGFFWPRDWTGVSSIASRFFTGDKHRQCIKKSRDITLLTKVCIVKAMVFPVIMYGYESWTIKKTECQKTDAFELCCWRRLLRVPYTVRRSNQSTLKETNPVHSLEELMLKLKLQYFGRLRWRDDSLEKTLMLGKIEGRRGREWQMMG